MILIIDGIDKAGKSTLIENLKNQIPNLLLMKILDKPKDDSMEEREKIKTHYNEMLQLTNNDYFVYVMDRWFTSEMAYSFKRGYEAISDKWFEEFERKVGNQQALFVLLHADQELVKQRFASDKEDHTHPDEIEKIMDRYNAIYENMTLNKMKVDTTNNLKPSVERIVSAVFEVQETDTFGEEF